MNYLSENSKNIFINICKTINKSKNPDCPNPRESHTALNPNREKCNLSKGNTTTSTHWHNTILLKRDNLNA